MASELQPPHPYTIIPGIDDQDKYTFQVYLNGELVTKCMAAFTDNLFGSGSGWVIFPKDVPGELIKYGKVRIRWNDTDIYGINYGQPERNKILAELGLPLKNSPEVDDDRELGDEEPTKS